MPTLAIYSRDADKYKPLIEQAQLPELALIHCSAHPPKQPEKIDILLGEPDLLVHMIDLCHQLTWFQSTWAGNTPLLNHNKQDYQLTGIKSGFGQSMSEYVFAYVLHHYRQINTLQTLQSSGLWQGIAPDSLQGKTMAILGMGSIGKHVAKTAKAFNMKVLGLSRTSQDCEYVDAYFTHHQKLDLAQQADVVVSILPDTPQTTHLIDKDFLAAVPNHCLLINSGRANAVDTQALVSALNNQQLAGAVLDVFEQEPLPQNHPLWGVKNLLITQHSAAKTRPEQVSEIFIKNYHLFLQNQPLVGRLDFSKGY